MHSTSHSDNMANLRWCSPNGCRHYIGEFVSITETEMSSFWRNFRHWRHWKLSFWQLSVQPVMKISSKWWHFRFCDQGIFRTSMCCNKYYVINIELAGIFVTGFFFPTCINYVWMRMFEWEWVKYTPTGTSHKYIVKLDMWLVSDFQEKLSQRPIQCFNGVVSLIGNFDIPVTYLKIVVRENSNSIQI